MIYKRKIINKIQNFLLTDDVIVLHGARQVGKTSIMKFLMNNLSEHDYFYIDLEDSRFLDICNEGPQSIISFLKQKGLLGSKLFYLFIDEIQYLSNPSSFIKMMHDHHNMIKLIVSGSSSFEIKKKFKDSLVGRTINFEIFPLDFEEYLIFNEVSINIHDKITEALIRDELLLFFKKYVLYGGYPKIALTNEIALKELYLQQIIDTYVKKDIRDIANIRNLEKFNKLLRVLANQSGNLLNVTEIANTTRIAKQTIEEYLFILENTYIIKLLSPYSNNIRSELFKTPKIYFYDTGILNLLKYRMLPEVIDGNMLETAIFSEFIKNIRKEHINYWRTQDKKEIDFIVNNRNKISPIEVKVNSASLKTTSLKYFAKKYFSKDIYCLSLEGENKNQLIEFIFPWDLYNNFF